MWVAVNVITVVTYPCNVYLVGSYYFFGVGNSVLNILKQQSWGNDSLHDFSSCVSFCYHAYERKPETLQQCPFPCNLCPFFFFFSWPLWYLATVENGGRKLYYCIGFYLHRARRHFLTVTWGANTFFFFFQIMGFWKVMLNTDWNEVLIGAQSFPVQLWSFISIQTCGRPALPVLGFCRAEFQSTYSQNAQVSPIVQSVYSFWACMNWELYGWFTVLQTYSLS